MFFFAHGKVWYAKNRGHLLHHVPVDVTAETTYKGLAKIGNFKKVYDLFKTLTKALVHKETVDLKDDFENQLQALDEALALSELPRSMSTPLNEIKRIVEEKRAEMNCLPTVEQDHYFPLENYNQPDSQTILEQEKLLTKSLGNEISNIIKNLDEVQFSLVDIYKGFHLEVDWNTEGLEGVDMKAIKKKKKKIWGFF